MKNLSVIVLAVVLAACFQTCVYHARAQSAPGCYGMHVPICSRGSKPVCVCTGEIGQNCQYVCVAQAHD